jgi:hypothetical protein
MRINTKQQEPLVPKAILFTSNKPQKKQDIALKTVDYPALARRLTGRMDFAVVTNKDRKLVKKLGLSASDFPMLFVYTPPRKLDEDDVLDANAEWGQVQYQSRDMSAGTLSGFLSAYALEGAEPEEDPFQHLADASCFDAVCVKRGGLCAILVTSDGGDRTQAALEKQVIKQVLDRQGSTSPYHFGWLSPAAQVDFLDAAFGVQPQPYAQVVVLAAGKRRFAQFVGSFQVDTVHKFLRGLTRNAAATTTLLSGDGALPPFAGTDTELCPPEAYAAPVKQPAQQQQQQQQHQQAEQVDAAGELASFNSAGAFEARVSNAKAHWLVLYSSAECDECAALDAEFKAAALSSKNMVRFARVQCDDDEAQALCEAHDVASYPAVRVFRSGAGNAPEEYTGEPTAKALGRFALSLLKPQGVLKLFDMNGLQSWMQRDHMMPRCILFSSSDRRAPPFLLRALRQEFAGEMRFAFVQNKHRAFGQQFNVTRVPSVVILQPELVETTAEQRAAGHPEQTLALRSVAYDGALSFNALHAFFLRVIELTPGAEHTAFLEPVDDASYDEHDEL